MDELAQDPTLSRRSLLRRAAAAGIALPGTGALLAACGGSSGGSSSHAASGGPLTGQIVLNNYPDWIGPHEIATFEKLHPGATVKQVTNAVSSSAEVVLAFKGGQYDFLLGDTSDVGQAHEAGVLQQLDFSKIPNLSNVTQSFRSAYPYGIPTDYGKVGIAYRPDIVGEKITSWHDVWRLAPKLSGQVVFIDIERDTMGSTMKYLGYSSNTTDPKALGACRAALIQIKPHLKAFLNTNVGQGLVDGSTAIAMDWDYDVALNKAKQPKIEWVEPAEGMHAYLEGFAASTKTKHLNLVQAFMNFLLEPKQYAQFVNTTGTAYVVPKATPLIQKSISRNPILVPSPATLKKVEFDHYLGGAGATAWANIWQEVKAA
ncbi:MAG: ABC transporter substrate-binding protein [Solirubrobacteraceae bacterium]